MPNDLDKLEALARAATPGEWIADGVDIRTCDGWMIGQAWFGREQSTKDDLCNAAYIATANPAAILALIKRVRVAEAALADVRDAYDGHEDADDGIPNLAMRCMMIAEGKNRP